MANPFYVQPANPMQGIQGLMGGVEKMQERSANQAKYDQQKNIMTSYFDAMDSGDVGAQRMIMRNNPIMSQQLQQISSLGNEQQDNLKNEMASRVMNEGMTGQEVVDTFGGAAKSLGMDISRLAGMPQDQVESVATQSWQGSEQHKRWVDAQEGGAGGASIGAASPKDFTVDSLAEYERTGDRSKLVRHVGQIKKIAGIEHQYNPEKMKWEPLVDLASEEITEQAAAAATLEADKQSRLDYGKEKIKFQQGRTKYQSQIKSAQSKQKRLLSTVGEIKKRLNNWSSKYGAALSGLNNTEARTLKNLITTVQANSAFGALTDLKNAGGTLGAISGTELELLSAVFGTLDQGGDNAELVRVLDQIVDANAGSITNIQAKYDQDNTNYKGSYDDFTAGQAVESQPVSDEDLVNKYLQVK